MRASWQVCFYFYSYSYSFFAHKEHRDRALGGNWGAFSALQLFIINYSYPYHYPSLATILSYYS